MRAAFGFLTTFAPAGPPSPRALRWFPLVGAVVGGLVGVAWWGAQQWWPAPVAAVLVVTLDLVLTGIVHLDGLADAADGLLPPVERERRLAIMRTPEVGAFGATLVVVALLLRASALATLTAEPLLIVALWTTSRALVACVPALVPYAREEGAARGFLGDHPSAWPALAVVPALAVAVAAIGIPGVASVLAAVVAAGAVVGLAHRRIGGFTGDVLGATVVVAETVGLVVAAARW